MSKYYTPTREEFYIGFECEIKFGDYWKNIIVGEDIEEMLIYGIPKPNNSRVKYLDKEDIESLGWEAIIDKQASALGIPQIFYIYRTKKDKIYKLRHSIPDHLVINGKYGGIIFDGRIKNKSEFKRLMKQLEIYE